MATYQMEDGTVVKTQNSTADYYEQKDFDGHNMIGRSSLSQWRDQSLHRSRKGRYYLLHESRIQGERDWAEWVSQERAAAWLVLNEIDLPEELAQAADKITE